MHVFLPAPAHQGASWHQFHSFGGMPCELCVRQDENKFTQAPAFLKQCCEPCTSLCRTRSFGLRTFSKTPWCWLACCEPSASKNKFLQHRLCIFTSRVVLMTRNTFYWLPSCLKCWLQCVLWTRNSNMFSSLHFLSSCCELSVLLGRSEFLVATTSEALWWQRALRTGHVVRRVEQVLLVVAMSSAPRLVSSCSRCSLSVFGQPTLLLWQKRESRHPSFSTNIINCSRSRCLPTPGNGQCRLVLKAIQVAVE